MPRITFEENVILQRKTWYVPKALFPEPKRANESPSDYFLKINQWRIQNDLPQEVFISTHPRQFHKEKDRKTDDYKPQYIHFNNPVLVELFGKNLAKVEKALEIKEMLPSSEDLITLNGQRRVTEFLLQWKEAGD